jgi:hypothetical protein
MSDSVTVFVPGTVYWAKVVGYESLVDNYERTAREWTYELVPDDTTFLKDNKILDRLKDKEDAKNPDKGPYLMLRKPEFTAGGERNRPITIYDSENNEWDDRKLGNGTRVVAKLVIKDWGKGKKKSIYTNALRVEELVPYEGGGAFAAYDGDTSNVAVTAKPDTKNKAAAFEELDDDLPF